MVVLEVEQELFTTLIVCKIAQKEQNCYVPLVAHVYYVVDGGGNRPFCAITES